MSQVLKVDIRSNFDSLQDDNMWRFMCEHSMLIPKGSEGVVSRPIQRKELGSWIPPVPNRGFRAISEELEDLDLDFGW